MDQKAFKLAMLKHATYTAILILLFSFQVTPGLFWINYVGPTLVIPFVVSVAFCEGELVGGAYGLFAGLLCDSQSSAIFGILSLWLMFCGIVVGLLEIYFLRRGYRNVCVSCFVIAFGYHSLLYFLIYGMWNYENSFVLYTTQSLGAMIYTVAVSPLIYYLYQKVWKYFADKEGEEA